MRGCGSRKQLRRNDVEVGQVSRGAQTQNHVGVRASVKRAGLRADCRPCAHKRQDGVLAHLSEENNSAELAFAGAVQALAARDFREGRELKIIVAKQYTKSEVLDTDD